MAEETEDLWLFGYGSLIWKPPPHYESPATSKATFAAFGRYDMIQRNQDHRGTPEAPGRVVTLIDRQIWETLTDQHASAPPRVWGAAYRIPSPHVAEVKSYLDIREINGYSIQYTPFQKSPPEQDISATYQTVHSAPEAQSQHNTAIPAEIPRCLVYIGLPSNPQFLGPQDPQELAEHIMRSRGPSGENRDYLFQLEEALDGLSRESGDEHVTDLARRCRVIEDAGPRHQ
ncbi:hypothetical protein LTR10_009208 [Elasticomyces elasticus]|nr:hypothetical protein LTR10_009208 [Elasticomyces elasticus]KAK4971691.1 hypothetical protein LTR42_007419 [Elasticomyces elasticus]